VSQSIPLPTDDGFLRRECPHCERQFKWHAGPTEERPKGDVAPDAYTCPLCGDTAPPNQWWTQEQLEFAQQAVTGPAMRAIAGELRDAFGKPSTGGPFEISMEISHDEPEPPHALQEPNDMMIVTSPCHPWEPVKVPEDWTAPLYCLLCGQQFTV